MGGTIIVIPVSNFEVTFLKKGFIFSRLKPYSTINRILIISGSPAFSNPFGYIFSSSDRISFAAIVGGEKKKGSNWFWFPAKVGRVRRRSEEKAL